jgi:hypothetical protein
MPALNKFVRDNADLAECFTVVGVHQPGAKSVAEVRREVASQAAEAAAAGIEVSDLPVVVVDDEEGMFLWYDPKGLGDMVLVDPRGEVAGVGNNAYGVLRGQLQELRDRRAEAGKDLAKATDAESAARALGALLDLGWGGAEGEAAKYAETCPLPLAAPVYEALARRGRRDVVAGGLESTDAKRRKAALGVMAKDPAPAWAAPLVAFARHKKTGPDDACAALRAAIASDPRHAELEAAAVELSKKGTTPVRACALEVLGRLATPGAVERLLFVLAKDVSASARSGAATALATVGGDAVGKALEAAASSDKVETVRAAARRALEQRAAGAAPAGG